MKEIPLLPTVGFQVMAVPLLAWHCRGVAVPAIERHYRSALIVVEYKGIYEAVMVECLRICLVDRIST